MDITSLRQRVLALGIVATAIAGTRARAETSVVSPPPGSLELHFLPALVSTDFLDQPSGTTEPPEPAKRLRSWELPAVTVVGEPAPNLREDERIGPYGQPRWTAYRRFPTTRVYVIPEGKVEVEFWARGTFNRDGVTEWRFLEEVEVGLPYRFQLDFYVRQDYNTADDETEWGAQFEVRWALADWEVLWGNPTLYFEYIVLQGGLVILEPKLLLGGDITERWHWGVNLVAELETGGERVYEYQLTNGVSYTVVDSIFSVGIEERLIFSNTKDDRGDISTSLVIGPSFQWKPIPPLTLNVAPLVGVTGGSPDFQLWINAGWEF